jgi:protein-tyrosine phosphatase
MSDAAADRPVRVLFTCTANRVRSPFAEYAARARLAQLGLRAEVRSAGLLDDGLPPIDEMVDAARRHGYDITAHRSVAVICEDLEQADLVVPMTGRHVVELVDRCPDSRPKILTLMEWAAASEQGRGVVEWRPAAVREWAAAEVANRQVDRLLAGDFDIADPIGGPRRHYRRAAELIDDALALCCSSLPDRPQD